ncbi:MAG: hypothetical protein HY057_14875 [Rhodospirillales bacterium]|nr:hypothetical protein [Rhodospirillales bacterium]
MDWTPDQIGELTRLWGEGLTTSEIGKRLGISKNAVVGKAHRLHLSSRPSPIKRSGRPPVYRRQTPSASPPAPAARLVPVLATPAATAPPKRVVELSSQSCRWPIGHPGDVDFHFCTDRAVAGKPYCTEHAAMAYVKVKPRAGEAA